MNTSAVRPPDLKLTRCPTCSSLPRDFTVITRTAPCLRQLPSCVAVYPRDSRSRRVLCRFPQKLHSLNRDVFYVADLISSIAWSVVATDRTRRDRESRDQWSVICD